MERCVPAAVVRAPLALRESKMQSRQPARRRRYVLAFPAIKFARNSSLMVKVFFKGEFGNEFNFKYTKA